MASIGHHTVLTMQGAVNPGNGEQVEEITRPGVDGVAYRRKGKRGEPFYLQTSVDVTSAFNAQALVESYKRTQGTIIDITDSSGRMWNNYIVLNVRPWRVKKLIRATGGISAAPAYLITVSWTLQATGTI